MHAVHMQSERQGGADGVVMLCQSLVRHLPLHAVPIVRALDRETADAIFNVFGMMRHGTVGNLTRDLVYQNR